MIKGKNTNGEKKRNFYGEEKDVLFDFPIVTKEGVGRRR